MHKNNKFNLSGLAWDRDLELLDEDYFEYIMTRHETFTNNPPIQTHNSKTENKLLK